MIGKSSTENHRESFMHYIRIQWLNDSAALSLLNKTHIRGNQIGFTLQFQLRL